MTSRFQAFRYGKAEHLCSSGSDGQVSHKRTKQLEFVSGKVGLSFKIIERSVRYKATLFILNFIIISIVTNVCLHEILNLCKDLVDSHEGMISFEISWGSMKHSR